MRFSGETSNPTPESVMYSRFSINLSLGEATLEEVPCRNLEDILGGFGRSFQFLADLNIKEAYQDDNPLIVNTGVLTGSDVMTGLRTYFSGYSPLKGSKKGLPAAMWSTGSGKFGSKMRWAGVDEMVFTGSASKPVYALLKETPDGPVLTLESADKLVGKNTHEKIMALYEKYPNAHFAAIGQGGENYKNVFYAAVALSTENQLKSGDDKCRFAGRGGMGSLMGAKNLLGIVIDAKDQTGKMTPGIRDINRTITSGAGSKKFREAKKEGLGGTWTNYEMMVPHHAVPENNFRPTGKSDVEKMSRTKVEEDFLVKAEACYRCGIKCHKNVYEKKPDGSAGDYRAKFDYEPVNLLSTNLGIHDPNEAWRLIALADNLGMDSISCGVTVAYVLDYNTRHPDKPLANGAKFGEFEKIYELIEQTGLGKFPDVGRGVARLAQKTGEPGYAMEVKGLELPAYLADTNPGYPWAIAGGHMSMYTFLIMVMMNNSDLDFWVNAITTWGFAPLREDLTGLCKFAGADPAMVSQAISEVVGMEVTPEELTASTRRAFLRGLNLERKQGYTDEEYTLPAQVFESPNPVLEKHHFVTPEYFQELKKRVWAVLEPEMAQL